MTCGGCDQVRLGLPASQVVFHVVDGGGCTTPGLYHCGHCGLFLH